MISSVTTFQDEDDDCDVTEPMSNEVWEISFDNIGLDDTDDNNIVTDMNDEDDSLASYNLTELQADCPDCRQIINCLCHGILPRDDATARKIIF